MLRPELTFPSCALAFIPALVLAWALRFFWGYWLALLAFWATRADALLALQDSLVFLLAGQVAPSLCCPGRHADRRADSAVPLHGGFPGGGADRSDLDAPDLLLASPSRSAGWSLPSRCPPSLWRAGCAVTPRWEVEMRLPASDRPVSCAPRFRRKPAYRANFWISLLHSLLNLATGVLGVVVLFGQVSPSRAGTLPPRWPCWEFI